jgi:transcriptional regulator with XRE-family HTH domain
MMTPVQCRMARAALGWGVRDLAAKARIGVSTVTRFEGGKDTITATVAAMQRAMEEAGVVFTNGNEPGVKLRRNDNEASS